MDWENERYIRVYVRDTADLLAIGWQGRAVWHELLRKVDRAGILDTTEPAIVAETLRIPEEIASAGLKRIFGRGMVIEGQLDGKPVLLIPNFQEAQEATSSVKERQRESRQRRRELARAEGIVTDRDMQSRNVMDESRSETETSRAVTACHKLSQAVTPSLAVPSQNNILSTSSKLDRSALVTEILEYLSEHGPKKIRSSANGNRKLVNARLNADRALGVDDFKLVIDHRMSEWRGTEFEQYVRPKTLFKPENWDGYLDDARAWEADGRPTKRNGVAVVQKKSYDISEFKTEHIAEDEWL